jgi:predicted dehydrogenase
MIKIGLLGAAKIAPKAIIRPAANRSDCTIAAVASRSITKAEAFAKEHQIPTAYGSYEALISDPTIDLIYNALPPNRHADLTIAALENGKSVLCEKPFAMNAPEAQKMVTAAEAQQGHLIEAYHYRFHPAAMQFFHRVQSGAIGELQSIDGVFNVSIPNRPGELRYLSALGGGALMDLGCYVLHFFRTLTGAEPDILSAKATQTESGVDSATRADMRFGEIKAALNCNMAEGTPRDIKVKVSGTEGEAIFEQFVHPYRGFKISILSGKTTVTLTETDDIALYTRSTYDFQLDHVMDVLAGKTVALTGDLDAVKTMHAIDKIYETAGFSRLG